MTTFCQIEKEMEICYNKNFSLHYAVPGTKSVLNYNATIYQK